MEQSRKEFIQKTVLGAAGTIAIPFLSKAAIAENTSLKAGPVLRVGIAGFTFAKFDVEQSIAMMKRLDMHYLSLKDFHLPLNSSEEKIKTVLSQFASADIKVYTVGVIY